MKILVIGSGGYVGSSLVPYLSDSHDIRCFSSSSANAFSKQSGIIQLNDSLLSDIDTVIYLSQSPYYRDKFNFAHVLGVNCLSPVALIEKCIDNNVNRFIYFSTANVYKPSFYPLSEVSPVSHSDIYSLSKLQAENVLYMYKNDISLHVVRPFAIYGRKQTGRLIPNLIQSVKLQKPVTLSPSPDLSSSESEGLNISLTYIDDLLLLVNHLCLYGGPLVINAANPTSISIKDICLSIGNHLSLTPVFTINNTPRDRDFISDSTLLSSFLDFTPRSFNHYLPIIL